MLSEPACEKPGWDRPPRGLEAAPACFCPMGNIFAVSASDDRRESGEGRRRWDPKERGARPEFPALPPLTKVRGLHTSSLCLAVLCGAELSRLLCHTDNHCPLGKPRLLTKLEPVMRPLPNYPLARQSSILSAASSQAAANSKNSCLAAPSFSPSASFRYFAASSR